MTITVVKVDELVAHPAKDQLHGVDYCLNSNPSWPEAVILGFQHYLVMLGTTVIISTTVVPLMGGGNVEKAQVVQSLLFASGINTLLQTIFGTRLPVVIGGSFRFILPALSVAFSNRYSTYINPRDRFQRTMRGIQGALLVASLLPIILGFLGVWRIVVRFLSPLSAVPLVTLVGLGLYQQGYPLIEQVLFRTGCIVFGTILYKLYFYYQLAQCVEVGLPELIILILLSQYIPHLWKSSRFDRYAILLSVALVWAYAAILTAAGAYNNKSPNTQFSCRVDRSGLIGGASWIRFPYPFQWGRPTVNASDVLIMGAAAFVALVESTGTFIAASRYGSATPTPPSVLSRGAAWLGVAMFLDGLWGTASGSTASVENAGLLALTRVGSRRVVQISAIFMLVFSVVGKFGAVVASIPLPIFGAIYCVLFGYMSSAGLGLLQFCNLNSYRTKFILGFALFMGLSVPQYFNNYVVTTGRGPMNTPSFWFNNMLLVIFTSPATVAFFIALFLDSTLGRNHSLTRKDSGRHWWGKFRHFDDDPRSADFYSLPYGLSKYFPSI